MNNFFHLFNKSISNFRIFQNRDNSQRFIELLDYYNNKTVLGRFSEAKRKKIYRYQNLLTFKPNRLVKFISYCIMPDHYHLLIKILENNILSKYLSDIENGFSRFFNLKFNRKGPLWQSRFKAVRVRSDEQLLHVSRYIHINPTTSNLVNKPEQWYFSSYRDFIYDSNVLKNITEISISNIKSFKKFTENQIDYQKTLKKIKKLAFD